MSKCIGMREGFSDGDGCTKYQEDTIGELLKRRAIRTVNGVEFEYARKIMIGEKQRAGLLNACV